MFKEIQKQIDETNAFTERLKALNDRMEILLENERQNQIKQAAELTRLEREVNDIIFDQTQKKKEVECLRGRPGFNQVQALFCPCRICSPFSLTQPQVYTNGGDNTDYIQRLRDIAIATSKTFIVSEPNNKG